MGETLTLLLIRHAAPFAVGTPGYAENDRPLTSRGLADAEQLAETLGHLQIEAIYSSPYRRAFQTIEPLSKRLRLEIEVIDDLRERYLELGGLGDNEWRAELERSWQSFDYARPGGETSRDAQSRGVRVLDRIRRTHRSGTIVAASHGNLISLALNSINPALGFSFWRAMPTPAVYELRWTDAGWDIVSGPNS